MRRTVTQKTTALDVGARIEYAICQLRGELPMPLPTIRPATTADIPHLVEWNCALASETEDKTLDRDTVRLGVTGVFDKPQRGFYLVAEFEKQPVGCLMVTYEWSDWRNGDFWWIQSVYVASSARRQGVFRALHREVEKRARAAGAAALRLYVERDNERAQKTYSSLGMNPSDYQMYECSFV